MRNAVGKTLAMVKTRGPDTFREELAYADFHLMGNIKEERLQIGQICILLRTDSCGLFDLLAQNYAVYFSSEEPIAEIEIRCQEQTAMGADQPTSRYFPHFPFHLYAVETISQGNNVFFISKQAFVGVIDRNRNKVRFNFFVVSLNNLENCLRIVLPHFFVQHSLEALLVHACSVATPAGGFLFPGKSGAGKTTIAQLAKEHPSLVVLTDEISLIRKVNGSYSVFGTPFWGEEFGDSTEFTNTRAPLTEILFPIKSREVFLRDLFPSRALTRLMPTVLSFVEDLGHNQAFMELCIDLLDHVPSRELHFSLGPNFWRYVV